MKKTRLLWFVAIILVLAVMPAMGSGQKEGAEKITLRWLHTPESTGDIENGAFFTALREKYPNVNFQIETMMYSAYPEKFPVMMASGDLPDIFRMKPQAYMPQLVESKLIAPLDEPLKRAGKDILSNARDGWMKMGQYGGKQYAIPAMWSLKYFSTMIRMDWLEKLGMAVPQTLDEFHNVARAFTFKDPDGNGKADTWGWSFRKAINFIDSFFHAYGVAPQHHHNQFWRVRNGKHTLDWVQPEMKDALTELGKWYKEGIIHPESITLDWPQWWGLYQQGKIGIWYHQPRRLASLNSALGKLGIPNARMSAIAPPKGPYGQGTSDEGAASAYFFSASNKYLEKSMEIYNYTFTQEFYLKSKGQLRYAEEAPKPELNAKGWPVYYTWQEALSDPKYDDRRKEVLYSQPVTGWTLENPNMFNTWSNKELVAYLKKAYQDSLDPATKEGYQLADKWAISSSKTSSVPADAKYAVNLQTMFREIMTRIVTGEDPNKVWDEWLAFYKANGGPELEKDVNEYIPIK